MPGIGVMGTAECVMQIDIHGFYDSERIRLEGQHRGRGTL